MLLALSDVPLRSGPFALEERWLLWARVQLYPDRVELTGWSLTGRHERQIPLNQIAETGYEGRRLRIDLAEGEEVILLVDEAARWASFIAAQRDVRMANQ